MELFPQAYKQNTHRYRSFGELMGVLHGSHTYTKYSDMQTAQTTTNTTFRKKERTEESEIYNIFRERKKQTKRERKKEQEWNVVRTSRKQIFKNSTNCDFNIRT